MQGGAFKNIIIFLLLAVLAFVAGSLASDGAQVALLPVVLVLGSFFLLYLGKNCWWLIFMVPPVFALADLSVLKNFPISFVICGIVLVYWLLMYIMGYVKVTWNGFAPLDVLNFILLTYFLSTWIANPVTLQIFTSITDEGYADVGGKEYFWAIGCVVAYLALSLIPISLESLIKVLKWTFIVSCIMAVIMCAKGLVLGGGYSTELAETTRYSPFYGVGSVSFDYLFAKFPVMGIVLSPWKLVLVLGSCMAIAMSGFRENILEAVVYAYSLSFIHRQLIILLCGCVAVWGFLVYLSNEKMLDGLPYGAQRVLTAVPGVEIENKEITGNAEHSLEWRFEMWRWAMTPSEGYIKDYVWGDGFGQSMYQLRLTTISMNRGKMSMGDQRFFAETGVWHSGVITAIHRTGFVGLTIIVVWSLVCFFYIFRVSMALRHVKGREFIYLSIFPFVSLMVQFYISAGSFRKLFDDIFYTAALAKVVCSVVAKKGLMPRMFTRQIYVPLIHREAEDEDEEESAASPARS